MSFSKYDDEWFSFYEPYDSQGLRAIQQNQVAIHETLQPCYTKFYQNPPTWASLKWVCIWAIPYWNQPGIDYVDVTFWFKITVGTGTGSDSSPPGVYLQGTEGVVATFVDTAGPPANVYKGSEYREHTVRIPLREVQTPSRTILQVWMREASDTASWNLGNNWSGKPWITDDIRTPGEWIRDHGSLDDAGVWQHVHFVDDTGEIPELPGRWSYTKLFTDSVNGSAGVETAANTHSCFRVYPPVDSPAETQGYAVTPAQAITIQAVAVREVPRRFEDGGFYTIKTQELAPGQPATSKGATALWMGDEVNVSRRRLLGELSANAYIAGTGATTTLRGRTPVCSTTAGANTAWEHHQLIQLQPEHSRITVDVVLAAHAMIAARRGRAREDSDLTVDFVLELELMKYVDSDTTPGPTSFSPQVRDSMRVRTTSVSANGSSLIGAWRLPSANQLTPAWGLLSKRDVNRFYGGGDLRMVSLALEDLPTLTQYAASDENQPVVLRFRMYIDDLLGTGINQCTGFVVASAIYSEY